MLLSVVINHILYLCQVGKLQHGIAGIERKLNEQQRRTDSTIDAAFEDLDALMVKVLPFRIISYITLSYV